MNLSLIKRFDLQPKYGFYVDFSAFFGWGGGLITSLLDPSLTTYLAQIKLENLLLMAELTANFFRIGQLVKGFDRTEFKLNDGDDINVGSVKISTMKSISMEDFNIEMYLDSNLLPEKLYYLWMAHIIDYKTGLRYPRKVYERDITTYFYDRKLINLVTNENPIEVLIRTLYTEKRTYQKCYPSSFEKVNFSMEDADFVGGVNINFKCNGGMLIDYNIINLGTQIVEMATTSANVILGV